jgi:hypothetical protein
LAGSSITFSRPFILTAMRPFRTCIGLVLIVSMTVSVASAEPSHDLSTLRKYIDRTVYIKDVAGDVTSRRLVEATRSELVVAVGASRQVIPASQITSVTIDGDPLWNGALIGGAVGVAVVLAAPFGGGTGPYPHDVSAVAGAFGLGAAFGAWKDWRHKGQTVVYQAP